MLPHFVAQDIGDVVRDLRRAGYALRARMVRAVPRVPLPALRHGRRTTASRSSCGRPSSRGTCWARKSRGTRHGALRRFVGRAPAGEGHAACTGGATSSRATGAPLPLTPTGVRGEYVAGVRYRAWAAAVGAASDHRRARAAGLRPRGHVERALASAAARITSSHPGGRSYETFPVNANEAEARRVARFWPHGHTPGPMRIVPEPPNPSYPFTLDLRRTPRFSA